MGVVYLGFDRHLGRQVAIKTLTEGHAQDAEMLRRFYREATKTGALMHPNIVIVYDLGEQDGFPYIVMEYVPGTPLDKIIQSKQPLSLISKLKVIEQVCLALGFAHRNDVIHRDVKPANVIVQSDDHAKLLDFGIAHHEIHDRQQRLTKRGNVLGTMHYMAPERWKGAPFDGRSDIFSAGVMLYELLASHLPFHGEDAAIFHQILHEPAPPLSKYLNDYPAALDNVIHRAMAKNPNDRPSTAEEMASEIASISEKLRKEQGAQMFQQAEQLMRAREFAKARDLLSQVIHLDSKNIDARRLLATVQTTLAVRERVERVQQIKIQAQEAIREKRYPQALSLLEEALQLEPSDRETQQTLESVRRAKRAADEVEDCLRTAAASRAASNLESAKSALERARTLDPGNSAVKSAWDSLSHELEAEEKRSRLRKLLEFAHAELQARHFSAADRLLRDATNEDPGNAEVIKLLQTVKAAEAQDHREKVVAQIQTAAAAAVTVPELLDVSAQVDAALQQIPADPVLLKLKARLDLQLKDLQIRATVDETVQRCYPLMENSPRQALELVRQKLRDFPAEERLLILQSAIEERLAHLKLEEARASYLSRAHEAIRSRRYREAVQVLENCQAEGILSAEITDLLEFARHEARRGERAALIETAITRAQGLIAQGSYDEVISLIEPVLAQYDDPALRMVLEKARAERLSEQQRLDGVLTTAQQLAAREHWDEAITFLEQQPDSIRATHTAQTMLRVFNDRNDQEGKVLQALGSAYAALHRGDVAAASHGTAAVREIPELTGLGARLANSLEARLTQVADQIVKDAVSAAHAALDSDDPRRALEILANAAPAADFAALETRREWNIVTKQTRRVRLLRTVGIRTMRQG